MGFLNKLFTSFNIEVEGQKGKDAPHSHFDFTKNVDDVSVETDFKEEIYNEEKKNKQKKFM